MDILSKRYKEVYNRNKDEGTEELQRFLFLDIDGVLNTIRFSDYLIDHDEDEVDEDGSLFDPKAVANLATIINNVPDMKIIISSSWRFKGWEWMKHMWEKRQMPGYIYDFTPALDVVCFTDKLNGNNTTSVYPIGTRGLEINEWLRNNASMNPLMYKYVIMDDEKDLLLRQQDNFIHTDPYFGITKDDVVRALEILL